MPNSEAAVAGMLGGLIGAAIVAEKRYAYLISTVDGKLTIVKKKTMKEILSDRQDSLLEYGNEEDPKSADVLLKYAKVMNN